VKNISIVTVLLLTALFSKYLLANKKPVVTIGFVMSWGKVSVGEFYQLEWQRQGESEWRQLGMATRNDPQSREYTFTALGLVEGETFCTRYRIITASKRASEFSNPVCYTTPWFSLPELLRKPDDPKLEVF